LVPDVEIVVGIVALAAEFVAAAGSGVHVAEAVAAADTATAPGLVVVGVVESAAAVETETEIGIGSDIVDSVVAGLTVVEMTAVGTESGPGTAAVDIAVAVAVVEPGLHLAPFLVLDELEMQKARKPTEAKEKAWKVLVEQSLPISESKQ
jgi:hypothetical protein